MSVLAGTSPAADGRAPAERPVGDDWQPGPRRPQLAEGAVHVWRADLATAGAEVEGLLCAAERERAARVLHQRDRQLWMRARGVLRALLARYVHSGPAELRFIVGAHEARAPPARLAGRSPCRRQGGDARATVDRTSLESHNVAAGLAVLDGIAAADAACCKALGESSRGPDRVRSRPNGRDPPHHPTG